MGSRLETCKALALTYEHSYNPTLNEGSLLRRHGSQDLAEFPETARRRAGYELFMVQVGREPTDFKPIPEVGQGAYELRVQAEAGAFRVIYVAKFKRAVYVLHTFQKKTRKTAQADIELAARRYTLIGEQS